MIQQLLAIVYNTFTESIRQPVFVVLMLTTMLALSLCPSIASYTLDDDNVLLIDMGLSTLFIAGLFIAVFTATGVLSTEIENKTILTVISKPVARPVFVGGKFLGVGSALAVGFWTMAMIFLLTVRHGVLQTVRDPLDGSVLLFGTLAVVVAFGIATVGNYMLDWVFNSVLILSMVVTTTIAWLLTLLVGKGWSVQSPKTDFDLQLMLALLLIFQMVLIVVAAAIAASTRLGRTGTLGVCLILMICGLMSDPLHEGLAHRYALATVIAWVMPDLQPLWPGDALIQGHELTGRFIWLATGYTGLYILALLALGVGLFQQKEIR